jgi:hypothetical protein
MAEIKAMFCLIYIQQCKRRAGHRALNPQAGGNAAGKLTFSRAQVAAEQYNITVKERLRQHGANGPGLFSAV